MDFTKNGSTGKRRILTSHKLGFFLIILGLVWGFYLLRLTAIYEENKHRESEVLKAKIVDLSKKYIAALSKEHTVEQLNLPSDGRTHMPEMKKATTVLLQNMLDRIETLEAELHSVVINSTLEFAKVSLQIGHLNSSMYQRRNESGDLQFTWMCEIPLRPEYPDCSLKVAWLQLHWKEDPTYVQHGVNESLCSMLTYLSQVENHCPQDFVKKPVYFKVAKPTSSRSEGFVAIPNDAAYPQCAAKVHWLEQYWKSDPAFAARGVDGSRKSFIMFLSEVEDWCPLLPGRKKDVKGDCNIPKSPSFPGCGDKIAWMKIHWKQDPCYAAYGVNGSICSFIMYLSEVENWCPLNPGRHPRGMPSVPPTLQEKPNLNQRALRDLLKKLESPAHTKFMWIKSRLTNVWSNWLKASESLEKNRDLSSYSRKRIMLYIGLLADENIYHFGADSAKGGPLGELVQWSDLIASLYLLGHDVTVSVDKAQVKRLLSPSMGGFCPSNNPTQYDIIYLDYIGLKHFMQLFGSIGKMKCHIRVVDSFGTEAQFNHFTDPQYKNPFGSYNLDLKQFNTMFPHSPDNTFLGFAVGRKVNENEIIKKKPIALVYGKHPSMWEDKQKRIYLERISEYFEIHATVGASNKKSFALPVYVKNHGVLERPELMKLLRSAKVFVGMGFPFEGPAPLEALANGCFFLNAKLDPPLNRENSEFFKSKPTFRKITSQHPYAEHHIGMPRVHTLKLNSNTSLENALKYMKKNTVKPFLPFEFTFEGTLERIFALTKLQNFCQSQSWPPITNRKTVVSKEGQSCKAACEDNSLVCEPTYFDSINSVELMKKNQMSCSSVETRASLVAPSSNSNSQTCTLQTEKLMFSCTAASRSTARLCPCRDFVAGQSVLCRGCL